MTHTDISEPRRWAITVSIMLATLMNSLDTTIANVALPHMQSSVQASQEQITWVLTSYILSAAVMTPLVSWLAERYGRKQLFVISIAVFTGASVLCGVATSLWQLVLFRVLQGVGGAALIPLSQAELLDINPPERHGQAMAVWGAGAVLGPVLGPALGGYLTDQLNWRWVFLINLPVGALALAGVWFFISAERRGRPRRFDFFGFAVLTLMLASLQLIGDRGPTKDWFSSPEIWTYVILAALGFYWFAVHTATTDHPFFDPRLLADRNYLACTTLGFFVGTAMFGSMALLPLMMEALLGYPVVTTGLVLMPRGLGSFLSMFVVGQLVTRVDTRILVLIGLAANAIAAWLMGQFSLQMDSRIIIVSGFIQGSGIGMIFVPLSTMAFATVPISLRTEGAALYTLVRNMGGAAGIALLQAFHVRSTQTAHSVLVEHLRPDDPEARAAMGALFTSGAQGQAMMASLADRQAAMIAYVNDFHLLFLACLAVAPLLLLVRTPKRAQAVNVAAE